MNKDGTFQIKFDDNTEFMGNLFDKDWRKITDTQKIKEIIFTFGGKSVKMENYKEYNLTFCTFSVFGKGNTIRDITLAGRGEDNSILIIYDFMEKIVINKEVEKYREYQTISSTWKKGISNDKKGSFTHN